MIQGLQMLCGVVLLAVITVGQTWGAEPIDIRLQSGTPLEKRGRDQLHLATFVHEQLHWFLTDHVERAKTNAALTELRALYPTVPTALPKGAMGERSTYLHLIVCHLELQALTALLGEQSARQQLGHWTHYTWVYRTVLTRPSGSENC